MILKAYLSGDPAAAGEAQIYVTAGAAAIPTLLQLGSRILVLTTTSNQRIILQCFLSSLLQIDICYAMTCRFDRNFLFD